MEDRIPYLAGEIGGTNTTLLLGSVSKVSYYILTKSTFLTILDRSFRQNPH
jgi:hypothetical protein